MTLPRAAVLLVQVAVLVGLVATTAQAQGATPVDTGVVSVIEVSGLIDTVLVDFIDTQITAAEADGALALVLQLNSRNIADLQLELLD